MISTFRALKYRNFRLFFPGLMTAQIGMWTQNVAISWLVYDITKSPFVMGTIMGLSALPLFIVTPFAGVITDKFDKHKLLMLVQHLYAMQALIMTVLTFTGHINIIWIAIMGVFLNIIASIDGPLRQSMFVLLVDNKEDLNNAIALNSTCFNAARMIGPAISGLLIAYLGIKYCFLINFLCFIPVNILTQFMTINEIKGEKIKNETVFEGLKEGITYVLNTPKIGLLLVYIAIFSFLGMTYPLLMPVYTEEVLHKGADTMGLLMSVCGIGAISGSLYLASKSSVKGLKNFLFSATLLLSLGFIVLGRTNAEIYSFLAMIIVGVGSIGTLTSLNTLIQSVVNNDIRGRVMSIHSVCFLGTQSISNFFAGTVTHTLGISKTFIFLGLILSVCCIYFIFKLRKYYYV